MMPLANVLKSFGISYHFYADDTQIFLSFDPSDPSSLHNTLNTVELCVCEIKQWMATNMLKLNDDKTEVLFIASPYFRKMIEIDTFKVNNINVTPERIARNIGVIFDDSLSFHDHISSICRSSFYYLKNIGAIRKYLTQDACATLVHSFITSKLDYCNSLLAALPSTETNRLQKIMNTAARIVTRLPKREHITPVLKSLHWLPIEQRIKYKILLFVHRSLHNTAPLYLSEIITWQRQTRNLRSANQFMLSVPKTHNSYGDRAFSVYGPKLWNDLPLSLKCIIVYDDFKTNLKTYLFAKAF
jgi:hypothetical protein